MFSPTDEHHFNVTETTMYHIPKKQHLKMVLCKLCVSGFEHCGPDYTHTVSAGHLSANTTIHPMVHNSLINDSC